MLLNSDNAGHRESTPISDMMFSVLPVSNRISATRSAGGIAMRMIKGSMNDRDLCHQDQVDHDDHQQADAEFFKGMVHVRNGPRTLITVLRSVWVSASRFDSRSNALQSLGLCAT